MLNNGRQVVQLVAAALVHHCSAIDTHLHEGNDWDAYVASQLRTAPADERASPSTTFYVDKELQRCHFGVSGRGASRNYLELVPDPTGSLAAVL